MTLKEYNLIKDLTYTEYCNYLQLKYGVGRSAYFYPSFQPNPKCKRTKDGLFAHHKKEDQMILLSTSEIAEQFPFEWQEPDEIVYCDYLEHLLLHILICKYPNPIDSAIEVGLGGIINFLVPELNDIYSGWRPKNVPRNQWQYNCINLIEKDKAVYLAILQDFIDFEIQNNKNFRVYSLLSSFNAKLGWNLKNNKQIFTAIKRMGGKKL